MRLRLVLLVILLFAFAAMPTAADAGWPKKVQESKDGAYFQAVDLLRGSHSYYLVDTRAELCFVLFNQSGSGGMTLIPCKNLKKRAEWKDIITWVDDE